MVQAEKNAGLTNTINFILEVDKLKGVLRKVRPISEQRYENTAEHSWQIALFCAITGKFHHGWNRIVEKVTDFRSFLIAAQRALWGSLAATLKGAAETRRQGAHAC
jgi:hypothetical protein